MSLRRSFFVCQAFSLAEVVLALGLCSIALLSIVGLLGVSMKSSQDAGDHTALAAMSQQVLTDLAAAPFNALGEAQPRATANPPATLPEILADSIYYFNDQGIMVAANADDVVYQCTVRKTPDASTRGLDDGPFNRVQLELHFTWPVTANADPARRPHQQRLHASLVRY